MIVYPKNWAQDYQVYSKSVVELFVTQLTNIIYEMGVHNLAYSGGIDSTILLCIMSNAFTNCSTFTIAGNESHEDARFAELGSKYYKAHHKTVIQNDKHSGIYKQFFESLPTAANDIICGDGIDEFMCGYYDHQEDSESKYSYYLSRLKPDHLSILNEESENTKVYVPYLNQKLINMMINIPLLAKVDKITRKKFIIEVAEYLDIPKEIIDRNKYGFCDAFIKHDK